MGRLVRAAHPPTGGPAASARNAAGGAGQPTVGMLRGPPHVVQTGCAVPAGRTGPGPRRAVLLMLATSPPVPTGRTRGVSGQALATQVVPYSGWAALVSRTEPGLRTTIFFMVVSLSGLVDGRTGCAVRRCWRHR